MHIVQQRYSQCDVEFNASFDHEMTRPTALVGFAEALAAPEVAWSLVDAGFNVIAFARKGRASALRHSRHVVCYEVQAPESNLQAALSEMNSLLASLTATANGTRRVLFPLDDKAVRLCSMIQLDPSWILAGPHGTNAELALHKSLQAQAAREAGFDVPKTGIARTADDILKFSVDEKFPLILRPDECVPVRDGRVYSCRKWICANPAELERAITEWAERVPLVVQPFVTGIGEGIFGLATPQGIKGWSAHRRLRMMNPQGSGSSACVSQPVSEDLKAKAEELIRKAGWSGLFMIELLRDHSGRVWFVELNGRPWGSMALSRRQGLEYPAWHVSLAMNRESQVDVPPNCSSAMTCRNVGREIMHLLFVLRGRRSEAQNNWPSFWKTVAEVLQVKQGERFYNWRREDPTVFFADCYYTIHDNLFKSRN